MERRGAASFGLLALLLVLALQVSVVDPGHGPHDVQLLQTLYPEHMLERRRNTASGGRRVCDSASIVVQLLR